MLQRQDLMRLSAHFTIKLWTIVFPLKIGLACGGQRDHEIDHTMVSYYQFQCTPRPTTSKGKQFNKTVKVNCK